MRETDCFKLLYEAGMAISSTDDVEQLFHIILTSVTLGDGLGFNRAALFLIDKKEGIIKGILGIGPDSAKEAARIWGGLKNLNLKGKMSEWLLNEIDIEAQSQSNFCKETQSIQYHIEESPFIQKFLQTKQAILLKAKQAKDIDKQITAKITLEEFAISPLISRGNLIGFILADNYFNKKPITENDLNILLLLSNRAAIAIDNLLNIEEYKQLNRMLISAQTQLLQTESLKKLGEATASVTHEIRNVLLGISGFFNRLKKYIPEDDEEAIKHVEIIERELQRLDRLVIDINRFSKTSVKSPQTYFDINQTIENATKLVKEQTTNKNIEFQCLFDKNVKQCYGNADRIEQVLLNLLNNAVDALKSKKTGEIKTKIGTDGKYVSVSVQDNAGGIDLDTISHIFKPFYTTKSNGTGLGLSIVKQIIQEQNGKIEIDNNIGKGVTFTIKLLKEKSQ
jgi:signal transduction histidine kinase